MDPELISLRVSRSSSSMKISHNKYQQTTPSIEASLRAGLAIGAMTSSQAADHSEVRRSSRRVKSPDYQKPRDDSNIKFVLSTDSDNLNKTMLVDEHESGSEHHAHLSPHTGNRSIIRTPETVVMRAHGLDERLARKQPIHSQRSDRVKSPVSENGDKSNHHTRRKIHVISTPQVAANQIEIRASLYEDLDTSGTDRNQSSARRQDSRKSDSQNLPSPIPLPNVRDKAPVMGSFEQRMSQLALWSPNASREPSTNLNPHHEATSPDVGEQSSSNEGTTSKPLLLIKAAKKPVGKKGKSVAAASGSQTVERRRQNHERNHDIIMEIDHDHEVTHPGHQETFNRSVIRDHPMTDKERALENLDEEIRLALRPHIPPPRRSERLRLKRVRKLHEKRIRLLDEIEADENRHRLVFNVDMRHVAVRHNRAI